MNFLLSWLISTLAIIITAYLLPSVHVDNVFAALVAALVIGVFNAILRPILIILTLPLTIFTLGLFALVINAALILLADMVVPGFGVDTFWWALLFSVILSVITGVLNQLKKF